MFKSGETEEEPTYGGWAGHTHSDFCWQEASSIMGNTGSRMTDRRKQCMLGMGSLAEGLVSQLHNTTTYTDTHLHSTVFTATEDCRYCA